MNVLLIGAGRMGLRHLDGIEGETTTCDVVDPRQDAQEAARAVAKKTRVATYASLDQLPADVRYDAAILASTASGRLELFEAVERRGIPAILVEKPVEQSRARARAVIERASSSAGAVWFNHYRRALPGYEALRRAGGPFIITVSSGAMGLGANGVHWIDFAVHLSGARAGRLLFGEIEPTRIGSGRGASFRDYGGRGLFAFPDESRLLLSCAAASSAPTMLSILTPTAHWIVDQHDDRAVRHSRALDADHPTYLYGKDYDSEPIGGLEAMDLAGLTRIWIQAIREGREPPHPRAPDVLLVYELLFDLMETSGKTQFGFT
jgi:predicted dehydrogenase